MMLPFIAASFTSRNTHNMIMNNITRNSMMKRSSNKTTIANSKIEKKEDNIINKDSKIQDYPIFNPGCSRDVRMFISYIILGTMNIQINSDNEIRNYFNYFKNEILPQIKNYDTKDKLSKIIDRFFSDRDFEITIGNLIRGYKNSSKLIIETIK